MLNFKLNINNEKLGAMIKNVEQVDKPYITAQAQADFTQKDETKVDYVKHKPIRICNSEILNLFKGGK